MRSGALDRFAIVDTNYEGPMLPKSVCGLELGNYSSSWLEQSFFVYGKISLNLERARYYAILGHFAPSSCLPYLDDYSPRTRPNSVLQYGKQPKSFAWEPFHLKLSTSNPSVEEHCLTRRIFHREAFQQRSSRRMACLSKQYLVDDCIETEVSFAGIKQTPLNVPAVDLSRPQLQPTNCDGPLLEHMEILIAT